VSQAEQRLKEDNEQRFARGLEPLSIDDSEHVRAAKAPSRLESLLITSQINRYASQIQSLTSTNSAKLYTAGALAGKQ